MKVRLPQNSFLLTLVIAATFAVPPLVTRALLLFEQRGWASLDIYGFGNDVLAGGLAASIFILVARWSRILAVIFSVAWTLLAIGNYENVRVLGSNLNPTYISYIGDSTFLSGSGLALTHPYPFAALALFSIFAAAIWTKATPHPRYAGLAFALAVGLAAIMPALPYSQAHSGNWRQENVAVASLASVWGQFSGGEEVDNNYVADLLKVDLNGEPLLPFPKDRPNVLLVVLESVSGAYLPSFREAAELSTDTDITMPLLDARSQQGLAFTSFLANQRQTNRGTFALLCGRLPKLSSATAKMTEYAQSGVTPKCLPEMLSEAGYSTTYLQSAPISFMHKDQFLKLAGFETVLGNLSSEGQAYSRGGWGVDDKAFFEEATNHINDLQSTRSPWFLTLLTSGTHHPFNIPNDYKPGTDRQMASYSYLDHAVENFLNELGDRGVLDDTLVILTSDESAGIGGVGANAQESVLSQNWSFTLALMPTRDGSQRRKRVSEVYTQADLAVSIADYLSLDVGNWPFAGRSMFREYDTVRPIFIANTFAQRQMALIEDKLVICAETGWACNGYDLAPTRHLMSASPGESPTFNEISLLKSVARSANEPLGDSGGKVALIESEIETPVRKALLQTVFAGQSFDIPAGHSVKVDLDVEVLGQGAIQLNHDFLAHSMNGPIKHITPLPPIKTGQRLTLSYEIDTSESHNKAEIRLYSRQLSGDGNVSLKFHKAEYQVYKKYSWPWELRSDTPSRVSNRTLSLVGSPDAQTILIDEIDAFQLAECVTYDAGKATAENCESRNIVFGPYLTAAPGSRIEFSFRAEVTSGELLLSADITSEFGTTEWGKSESELLRQGEIWQGSLTAVIGQEAARDLETRLYMKVETVRSSVTIRDLIVRVIPPASFTTAAN